VKNTWHSFSLFGVMTILLSCSLGEATASLPAVSSIFNEGRVEYSARAPTIYFPTIGEGNFEKFPFCTGSEKGQDWDWVNGYQMDANGNLYDYADSGTNPDVYLKHTTQHVQNGMYSAEFHLGEGTEPTHEGKNKHCKLFERDQSEYPNGFGFQMILLVILVIGD